MYCNTITFCLLFIVLCLNIYISVSDLYKTNYCESTIILWVPIFVDFVVQCNHEIKNPRNSEVYQKHKNWCP